ncbi:hypothetical protein NM688_g2700 [Phlebia brevispora]|uniref:Uncharacterized protein n=1 Tax=Phlebia brevispora TaxID=194682 RepID=A0ACC1T7M0_9APHY|nr:hypothetical protein NM688_g2700 [Phlebia brevispora]
MDPPDRGMIISPPPVYEESVADTLSTFDPEAFYGASDAGSVFSGGPSPISPVSRYGRRYSEASELVLPPEMGHRQDSSAASYRSAGQRSDDYSSYLNAAGLPTPPLSSSHHSSSIHSVLPPDTRGAPNGRSAYFAALETDDPAVIRTAFPQPPDHYPTTRQPRRGTNGSQGPTMQIPTAQPYQPEPPSPPFVFTFHDGQFGQMSLLPPENWRDNKTPLYIIDVHPNCFIPTSHITTLRRARTHNELVGRFEMGISRGEPTVFIGGTLYPMKDVFFKFRKVDSKLKVYYILRLASPMMYAETDSPRIAGPGCMVASDCTGIAGTKRSLCHQCWHESDSDHVPIARIKPASAQPPGSMSTRPPTTRLEIYVPMGPIIEEIIFSALIVERKRLSPSDGTKNEMLFN